MELPEHIVNEQLIKAVYFTLLHSLWQGAVIAALAGVIMMATKKSAAIWRYHLLLAAMIVFALTSAITFLNYMQTPVTGPTPALVVPTDVPVEKLHPVTISNTATVDYVVAFLHTHAHSIVLLWFLVICLKSMQMSLGLYRIAYMKRKHVSPVSAYWSDVVNALSEKIGLRQPVSLLESGIAKVPLTVGHLKPVILVPLGMLTALPVDQVEAILLHELAHIRRKDYLVNILQSLLEIVFFFNPAIWWLSSLLRTEREHCCDDIAMATSNSSGYIRALVSFEEYRSVNPPYATALTGSGNHLLKRIKRMVSHQNQTLNSMEKLILTSGLVIAGLMTAAFTHEEKTASHPLQATAFRTAEVTAPKSEPVIVQPDTVPAGTPRASAADTKVVNTVYQGKQYKMVTRNNQVAELYIDQVRIADETIGDYKAITDTLLKKAEQSRLMAAESRKRADQARLLAADRRKEALAAREQIRKARPGAERHAGMQAGQSRADLSREIRIATDRKIRAAERETRVAMERDIRTAEREIRIEREIAVKKTAIERRSSSAELRRKAEQDRKRAEERRQEAEKFRLQHPDTVFNRSSLNVKPYAPAPLPYTSSATLKPQQPMPVAGSGLPEQIKTEIVESGIAKSDNLSFHITNDKLVVNGKQVSDDLHQRILSKVTQSPADRINLTYSTK